MAWTRRDVLTLGSLGLAAAALPSSPALAQAPKRGGTVSIRGWDPPLFDPMLTTAYRVQIPLTFTHSRLVKHKAGPSIAPGTFAVEPDLAESWTQPNETTYVFKLRRGVRWHNKPPVNGRELTADDVRYSVERFLTVAGNPSAYMLRAVERVEAVDRYTVKFTLKEPFAWFLDMLANPISMAIVARECVEKFGDLRKVESVVGTGPWMLERWEPNVKLVYVRNPSYFVPGLPYADGVEVIIDKDPSSRLATWLGGKTDFGPEYQHAVRWLDLPLAKQRKPGLQTAEYTWFTSGATGLKLANLPFGDIRVRRGAPRAQEPRRPYQAPRFLPGHWT